MRLTSGFSIKDSSGLALVELVIALAVFTIAFLGMGYAVSGYMRVSDTLRDEMMLYSTFQQVLQETLERPFSELEAYKPPDYPSEKTIGTFSIPEIEGSGEIKLCIMKEDKSTGSKLIRVRVIYQDKGSTICELESYKTKRIH
jgi:type II secretory pathway component PulJ